MKKLVIAAAVVAAVLGLSACCPHGQNCNVASSVIGEGEA